MEAKLTTSNTSRVVDVDESLEEDERTEVSFMQGKN